jgi:hypothetical protein
MSETTPAELLTPANEASTRDLIQRLRELVFTFAGPAPGETMGIFSDRDVQDTFKCLQAAADYLQRFFEREAAHAQAITALHEQLEFQRKRADDRVAAYERQSLELEKIREYGGDELNTWEATDAQLRTLQAEKESDAWHQGWNVAVHERDQARQAITALQSDKKAQLRMVGQALRDLSVRLRREHEQAGDPIERDTAFYCADELDALIQTLEPPA